MIITILTITAPEGERLKLKRHERTGRSMGDMGFVEQLEQNLNRALKPQKGCPKGPWKHKTMKGGKLSMVSPEVSK